MIRKWLIRGVLALLLVAAVITFLALRLAGNLLEELVSRTVEFEFVPDAAYADLLTTQFTLEADSAHDCDAVPLLAERAAAMIPADPLQRYQLTAHFYAPEGLGHGHGLTYGYGQGQIDFTAWEYARGVLDAEGGSPWWQAVNRALLAHMIEAHFLHHAGLMDCDGTVPAVDVWLRYLDDPTPLGWYEAHNASIRAGYMAYEPLALDEPLAERIVMVNTLNRVTLADFMAAGRDLIGAISDPGGPAVDLITALDSFYPRTYPLDERDSTNAALLYLLERNRIIYAGVDETAVVDYLASAGMDPAEIERVRAGDTDLYRQIFPDYLPPEGAPQ